MTPSAGRIVIYTLTMFDAERINKRRADYTRRPKDGAQVHVGNPVNAGEGYPLVISRVVGANAINGQVILDGNDSLWVTASLGGEGDGCWKWPHRTEDGS